MPEGLSEEVMEALPTAKVGWRDGAATVTGRQASLHSPVPAVILASFLCVSIRIGGCKVTVQKIKGLYISCFVRC